MPSRPPAHVLTAQRLALRPPALDDAPTLAQLANDYDVAKMTARMPYPYALSDAQGFVQRTLQGADPSARAFVIEAEGAPAGLLGFYVEQGQRLPEVGYWLGRPYWGRGYATEALERALVWASDEWGRRAVRTGHFDDNDASGRVLTKAGFLYTGEVLPRFSRARGRTCRTRMMVWLA